VRCYLWPKGALHAPESADSKPPVWPAGGANARIFEEPAGHVRISWDTAIDPEGVYGYEIHRSVDGGAFEMIAATRANMHTTYQDSSATAGARNRYHVRAYDLAGNKSVPSNVVEISIPMPVLMP
jgi:fibronectin type 3 domain-containing protein